MDLNDAYKIHHIKQDVYSGKINYSTKCIYCPNTTSSSLIDDGSFRKCLKCKKHFRATILTQPVKNYNESFYKPNPI